MISKILDAVGIKYPAIGATIYSAFNAAFHVTTNKAFVAMVDVSSYTPDVWAGLISGSLGSIYMALKIYAKVREIFFKNTNNEND